MRSGITAYNYFITKVFPKDKKTRPLFKEMQMWTKYICSHASYKLSQYLCLVGLET